MDTWDRRASWATAPDRHRWHAEGAVRRAAACCDDLRRHLGPHLLGYLGDGLVADVQLRPFPQGEHHGPIIEAMALLVPLGCDRISMGIPGRAWSLDDPIAPVTDGVDLRQRVVVEVRVDASDPAAAPQVQTVLHPFELDGPAVQWLATTDPGPAGGWIPRALDTMMAARLDLAAATDVATLQRQASRVDDLGHGVTFSDLGQGLLGQPPDPSAWPATG